MDEKEIQDALKEIGDFPVLDRMARSFIKVHAERTALADLVKQFERQHNELYLVMVALMHKLGKEVLIEREHYPALYFGEYTL